MGHGKIQGRKDHSNDARLSQAAIETLAIISYRQPILRADIEAIRGVASGEVLRTLIEKQLVKIVGRAEVLGRPMLYGTTKRFLETFGLSSIDDLPNVSFQSFGAESIDAADQSFDAVLMFKSLHHVPVKAMDAALDEIVRVLKPQGLAYISEPVFAGAFNAIVRLFHDESEVRKAAFAALRRCVTANKLALAGQHFFYNRLRLKSFAQFEQGVLNVTHTDHQLSAELFEEVRARFEDHASDQGYRFEIPNRVDLLRKAPL